MNSPVPPCAGKWRLFDSTDPRDHYEAKSLCESCPMLADCLTRLEVAQKDAMRGGVGGRYGPQGTWAGLFLGGPTASEIHAQAEEDRYDEAEARAAHARYAAGARDEFTIVGERVYQRRKKRARPARKVAA